MTEEPLPTRLAEVLRTLPDREFTPRLERVFLSAASAIERLAAMELIPYESMNTEEGADLSLLEEMAPAIRDTVLDVNAVMNTIREEFPDQVEGDGDEPLGLEAAREKSRSLAHDCRTQMAQQVVELGERMRQPEVVADRWNLISELQTFRNRFREQMGELVFELISLFADVQRREVIPGYGNEVRSAVAVRATITDLRRLLNARRSKAVEADGEGIRSLSSDLVAEMDAFGRTDGFKLLRAQDKRQVIDLRRALGIITEREQLDRNQLLAVLDAYLEFAEGLGKVNNREFLISHDREVWAAVGVALEQTEGLLASDATGAAKAFAQVLVQAQLLYGRDSDLDGYLRRVRRMAIASLDGGDLAAEIDKFRELLAKLPMY